VFLKKCNLKYLKLGKNQMIPIFFSKDIWQVKERKYFRGRNRSMLICLALISNLR
jgi:hypothetical protein